MSYVIKCKKCEKPFLKLSNLSPESTCRDCKTVMGGKQTSRKNLYFPIVKDESKKDVMKTLQKDVDRLREEVKTLYAANISIGEDMKELHADNLLMVDEVLQVQEHFNRVCQGEGSAFDELTATLLRDIEPRMDRWVVTLNNRIVHHQKYTAHALKKMGFKEKTRRNTNESKNSDAC